MAKRTIVDCSNGAVSEKELTQQETADLATTQAAAQAVIVTQTANVAARTRALADARAAAATNPGLQALMTALGL